MAPETDQPLEDDQLEPEPVDPEPEQPLDEPADAEAADAKAEKPKKAAAKAAKPARKSDGVYVAVDVLSWRPHPLPRGTEVSKVLPQQTIDRLLAEGTLTREQPAER